MNKVIKVLEAISANPAIYEDKESIERLITEVELDEEVKHAILTGERSELESILDVRSKIVCMLIPAKEDEDDDSDDNDKEDDSESEEKSLVSNF